MQPTMPGMSINMHTIALFSHFLYFMKECHCCFHPIFEEKEEDMCLHTCIIMLRAPLNHFGACYILYNYGIFRPLAMNL